MKQGRSEKKSQANNERTTGIYYKLLLLYFFVGKSEGVTKNKGVATSYRLKSFQGEIVRPICIL